MLNLPDYYEIIKQPMDLGSVKAKLENREYKTPEEFVKDVRLMFTNCYKYNPSDHEIVSMGRKLQNVFEVRLAKMPEETLNDDASTDGEGNVMTSSSESPSESSSDSEEENEDNVEKIRNLQSQIQELSKQLSLIASSTTTKKEKKSKKKKSKSSKKNKDSYHHGSSSSKGGSRLEDSFDHHHATVTRSSTANNGPASKLTSSSSTHHETNLNNNGLLSQDAPSNSNIIGKII